MNEGKELLIDIISSYEDTLSKFEDVDIIISDINLIEAYNKLNDDKYYLADLPSEFIDQIIKDSKYGKHLLYKRKLNQLKDLYLGKKQYDINIKEKDEHKKILNTFKELMDKVISEQTSKDLKENRERLETLLNGVKYNEIINDYSFIEQITKEYNEEDYDRNMYRIMKYVAKHNYNILNDNTVIDIAVNSSDLKITEIDNEVKEILTKLYISYNDLPVDYKLILKDTSINDIKDKYELIKHNKVEDYGILHLIDKNDSLSKLIILLFSSVDAIKENVDAFKDNNDVLDVNSIKILMHTLVPTFVVINNNMVKPMHYNFINNLKLFKKNDINMPSLLKRCPLLFTAPNEIIKNVLNKTSKYNVGNKKVINKLYKVLSYNPSLVLDNINILDKYTDIKEYLRGDNYNLLKVVNLDKKIDYIINKYNVKEPDKINAYLIKEIYSNSDKYLWGDEDA